MVQQLQLQIESNSDKLFLLHLYLSRDFPYNFASKQELSKKLNVSVATIRNIGDRLEKMKLISSVRSNEVFYSPINDLGIRREVLKYSGIME